MRYWYDAAERRGDVVTIPTIWLALLLSLVVHLAALWEFLPHLQQLTGVADTTVRAGEPLAVRLAPAPTVPSPPAAQITPPVSVRRAQALPPPKAQAPKLPREVPAPVVAVAPPASSSVALPPPEPRPATPTPSPPVDGDLSSFIAARRRARGDPEPSSAESDVARRDRIVASNLAGVNSSTFGNEPKNSGGIFQIQRLGYDDAEFTFYGWSSEIRRRASQKIEVRRGEASDIRIAVIHKMIEIIRQYEQEDFNWNSRRLGRVVVLSARLADTPGLEEFMMREFFAVPAR